MCELVVAAVSPMVAGGSLAFRGAAVNSITLIGVELDRCDRSVRLRGKVAGQTRRRSPSSPSALW